MNNERDPDHKVTARCECEKCVAYRKTKRLRLLKKIGQRISGSASVGPREPDVVSPVKPRLPVLTGRISGGIGKPTPKPSVIGVPFIPFAYPCVRDGQLVPFDPSHPKISP